MEIYKREITSYDKKYHVAYGKGVHMNFIKHIVSERLECLRSRECSTMYNIQYTVLSKHVDDFLVMQLKKPIFSLYHNQEVYIIRIIDIPMDLLSFELDIDSLHLKNISKYRFKLGSHYQWFYKDIPKFM